MPVLRNILVAFLLTAAGAAGAEDDNWCGRIPPRAECQTIIKDTQRYIDKVVREARRDGHGYPNLGLSVAGCAEFCSSHYKGLPALK